MAVQEYALVFGVRVDELCRAVNQLCQTGWVCQGGVSRYCVTRAFFWQASRYVLVQAMVRTREEASHATV